MDWRLAVEGDVMGRRGRGEGSPGRGGSPFGRGGRGGRGGKEGEEEGVEAERQTDGRKSGVYLMKMDQPHDI